MNHKLAYSAFLFVSLVFFVSLTSLAPLELGYAEPGKELAGEDSGKTTSRPTGPFPPFDSHFENPESSSEQTGSQQEPPLITTGNTQEHSSEPSVTLTPKTTDKSSNSTGNSTGITVSKSTLDQADLENLDKKIEASSSISSQELLEDFNALNASLAEAYKNPQIAPNLEKLLSVQAKYARVLSENNYTNLVTSLESQAKLVQDTPATVKDLISTFSSTITPQIREASTEADFEKVLQALDTFDQELAQHVTEVRDNLDTITSTYNNNTFLTQQARLLLLEATPQDPAGLYNNFNEYTLETINSLGYSPEDITALHTVLAQLEGQEPTYTSPGKKAYGTPQKVVEALYKLFGLEPGFNIGDLPTYEQLLEARDKTKYSRTFNEYTQSLHPVFKAILNAPWAVDQNQSPAPQAYRNLFKTFKLLSLLKDPQIKAAFDDYLVKQKTQDKNLDKNLAQTFGENHELTQTSDQRSEIQDKLSELEELAANTITQKYSVINNLEDTRFTSTLENLKETTAQMVKQLPRLPLSALSRFGLWLRGIFSRAAREKLATAKTGAQILRSMTQNDFNELGEKIVGQLEHIKNFVDKLDTKISTLNETQAHDLMRNMQQVLSSSNLLSQASDLIATYQAVRPTFPESPESAAVDAQLTSIQDKLQSFSQTSK